MKFKRHPLIRPKFIWPVGDLLTGFHCIKVKFYHNWAQGTLYSILPFGQAADIWTMAYPSGKYAQKGT